MSKISVAGDPQWAGAIGNIASLFDPRAAAEGSALQARTKNFEAEAGYNNARTGMLTDRRNALANVAALKAAGYTDRQIMAMQVAQPDRLSDIFSGVQTDEGTQTLLKGGDPRVGMTLLGQGAAASKPDFAFTDTRADQLNATSAAAEQAKAAEVQRLQNAGSLAVAQARPVELTAGSSALFAPGDSRNPNGVAKPLVYEAGKGMPMYRPGAMTSPSQVFTAPAAPGSVSGSGSGTGRVGNLSADETELLNKMKLEQASGQSIAGWGKYPIAGGTELIDLISAAAREAYPTDTPAVAAAKWKAANGITVDDDWNAFSANESVLQRGGKPLTTADLFSAPSANAPAAPSAGGQPAAPAGAAPAGAAPVAAEAPPAEGGVTPTKNGGFMIDGIPFEPSSYIRGERQHGDQYTGLNTKTKQLESRYWNANKNAWSKAPVFVGNGDAPDVARIKGEDTFLGVIPMNAEALRTAPARLIEQGRTAGIINEEALAQAIAADGKASQGSYRSGGNVTAYLQSLAPQFNALARTDAMKDPRVAKFAAGDFSGDAGLPDEAMALAEQMGINRQQFGIPEAGLGESLPGGLGAVFAPAGYGAAQETMARGLKEFFRAVQEGRVDPNSLVVRRPAPAQPVAAR